MVKASKKPTADIPLEDVTQQGWATSEGLRVFLVVTHPDDGQQKEVALTLGKLIDNHVQSAMRRCTKKGKSSAVVKTTQGLGALLAALKLPATIETE